MNANAARYTVTCRLCARSILQALRIAEPQLVRLVVHLRAAHPQDGPAGPADAGDVLRHFNVTAEPAQP